MYWFWLNIPLAAVIFLAITSIPLWMVIRHPDTEPAGQMAPLGDGTQQPRPAVAALPGAAPDMRAPAGREAVRETVGAAA